MTFTRKQSIFNIIQFSYDVNSTTLERSNDYVLVLGFKPTSSLDPIPHIDMVC